MAGAAVRKPRLPNDKLRPMTDNRLAEADRKVLHGVCRWSRLARYGGLFMSMCPAALMLRPCGAVEI